MALYDPHASPESPVDSAMFPNWGASAASVAPMAKQMDAFKLECADGGCEIEPFAYAPAAAARAATPSNSLSSVFGDQDLVDAIMGSLDLDGSSSSNANVMATPMQSLLAWTPMAQTPKFDGGFMSILRSVTAELGCDKVSATTAPTSTIAMPAVTRKPGTFLNKDGRWIKGKPCRMDSCDKRAQSNGLCKGHGGGARCSFEGCAKSSQGGGLCRAHGGGKRCMHEGCEKGTQRNGFCYLHGGVRPCSVEGCDKKDRGNGKCFSHGGGRKCQAPLCVTTIRRGVFCEQHSGGKASQRK